jgi:hypothetical protein
LKRLPRFPLAHIQLIASFKVALGLALVALAFSAGPAPIQAQATRTWVASYGNDADPCSRTAPCATFAGAISKTAPGGVISCVDADGYGTLNITKSLMIDCEGSGASVLASGTTGFIINAANTDIVTIRGVSIQGQGITTGFYGIRYINAQALHVEECQIISFNTSPAHGIFVPGSITPGVFQQLFVKNTMIRSNGVGVTSSGGITIGVPAPGAPNAGVVRAVLDNVSLVRNNVGLRISPPSETTVINSSIVGNISFGVLTASGGSSAIVNIEHTTISESILGAGVRAEGPGAVARLDDTSIFGNNIGIESFNFGSILSFGNNSIAGNFTSNGVPTGPAPLS